MEHGKILQFKWKSKGAKSQETAHVQWTHLNVHGTNNLIANQWKQPNG